MKGMTFLITLASQKRKVLDIYCNDPSGPKRLKYKGGMALPITLTRWRGQFLDNLFIFYESKKSLKETHFLGTSDVFGQQLVPGKFWNFSIMAV